MHHNCIISARLCAFSAKKQKEGAYASSFILGADDRTRTCTLARWNLNPMSLPIPPHPHIQYQKIVGAVINRPQANNARLGKGPSGTPVPTNHSATHTALGLFYHGEKSLSTDIPAKSRFGFQNFFGVSRICP